MVLFPLRVRGYGVGPIDNLVRTASYFGMTVKGNRAHLGEVIQATSICVTAQCADDYHSDAAFPKPPALGAFVYFPTRSGSSTIISDDRNNDELDPFVMPSPSSIMEPSLLFGIVSFVQSSSIDPGRKATALGIETEEELRQAQPQIFELLTTEFNVVLTSYTDSAGKLLHRLPSHPPRIHSFVYSCERAHVLSLTEGFGFLRTILSGSAASQLVSLQDLAAAAIMQGWEARGFDENYLIQAGRALLMYSSNDYELFQSVIQRVSPF